MTFGVVMDRGHMVLSGEGWRVGQEAENPEEVATRQTTGSLTPGTLGI